MRRVLPLAGAIATVAISFTAGSYAIRVTSGWQEWGPLLIISVPLAGFATWIVLSDPPIALMLVFATFLLGFVSIPLGFVSVQVVELATLAAVVLIALRRLGQGLPPLPWPPVMWLAAGLFAWAVIALPSSVDPELAVKQVAQLAGGIALACVVIAVCRTIGDLRRALGALVVIGGVISVIALASGGDMTAMFEGTIVTGRTRGVFDQPNLLGAFCAYVAPVAVGLALGASTMRTRLALGSVALLLVAALTISLSRGAWLGTALAILFLTVSLPRFRKAIIGGGVALLVIAALLGSFQPENTQLNVVGARVRALGQLSPYDSREEIWREARRQIVEDPVTGQGPGSFPTASSRSGSQASTVQAEHAHNVILTWAAEAGVPAAALIVALAIVLSLYGIRALRTTTKTGAAVDRSLLAGIQAGLIAVAGQGLVDYPLRDERIFLLVWALIGAMIALRRAIGPPEQTLAAIDRPRGTIDFASSSHATAP